MYTFLLVTHGVLALAIIGLILLQQGRGADAGAAFGGGATDALFGSAGAANALSRATAVMVALFFLTSFALAIHAKRQVEVFSDPNLDRLSEEQRERERGADDLEDLAEDFDSVVICRRRPRADAGDRRTYLRSGWNW